MADNWLYRFKLKIILGLVLLLAVATLLAMLVVIGKMRDSLEINSSENARQLGIVITSSLKEHMLRRTPEQIRNTLRNIGNSDQISKILILNHAGHVAFSTDDNDIDKTFDMMVDVSCKYCHQAINKATASNVVTLRRETGDVLRTVIVIFNEPACFGCHPQSNKINGKLIIDLPLIDTETLIKKIRGIILYVIPSFGIVCLLLIIPIQSKMIDRYIDKIIIKNNEIDLIYSVIDSISRTIDMEELKNIVIDIVSDVHAADEVVLILPKGEKGFRIISRTSKGEKSYRKKLNREDNLTVVVERWHEGRIKALEYTGDRSELYLPITKGDTRLALIVIRRTQQPFSDEKMKLMEAICIHIGIAFENARLYSMAITDELTGLFAVRHFRSRIDRQMSFFEHYGDNFSILIIDIDNFKRVNDTYGHPIGDAVLKKVAACIAESVRCDDLAFRYGGEEFTVILPATSLSGGLEVAERIRSQVEYAEIVVDGHVISATVSIGLSVCPDNAVTVKELIFEADKALYSAKHSGKNRTAVAGSQ